MNSKFFAKPLIRWALLLVSICVFGLLMGLRDELASIWLRAAMAATAFVILVPAIFLFRRRE